MKVSELLERRRKNWHELECLCEEVNPSYRYVLGVFVIVLAVVLPCIVIPTLLAIAAIRAGKTREIQDPRKLARFAALYRAVCADLALADAYQLPPNSVQYLHRLVGRAHNVLHRGRGFDVSSWVRLILIDTPQRIFNDVCVQFCFCLFWGVFIISAYLAHSEAIWPDFAETILGKEQIEVMEQNFAEPLTGRKWEDDFMMMSFYIFNNPWIGLQCFVGSLLVIPGLLTVFYNAAVLGASFGYMFRPDVAAGENFREFVTAHGPFELTAVVLCAGAGLRIGVGFLVTHGLSRLDSLKKSGWDAVPILAAGIILFFLAAMIEGFISPSALPAPFTEFSYHCKAAVALFCSGLLMFYFVVLGFPRGAGRAF